METNEKLVDYVVGSVPTVIYIPDFITNAEETQLFNHIYQAPISKWKTLMNRRLQNWGGVVHEKGLISQDLPSWLTKVTQRIYKEYGLFPAATNHVLINEYLPEQGIMPHQDGPAYFPTAAILSLGSPAVMNFTPHSRLSECNATEKVEPDSQSSTSPPTEQSKSSSFSVLLMPCSLLIFKDLAYTDYLHGIEDNAEHRYDRVVNLSEAVNGGEFDQLLSNLEASAETVNSGDVKILHRKTKRISLTCRLVLKVHKNFIKI